MKKSLFSKKELKHLAKRLQHLLAQGYDKKSLQVRMLISQIRFLIQQIGFKKDNYKEYWARQLF